jgi:hypothetical protein
MADQRFACKLVVCKQGKGSRALRLAPARRGPRSSFDGKSRPRSTFERLAADYCVSSIFIPYLPHVRVCVITIADKMQMYDADIVGLAPQRATINHRDMVAAFTQRGLLPKKDAVDAINKQLQRLVDTGILAAENGRCCLQLAVQALLSSCARASPACFFSVAERPIPSSSSRLSWMP